MLLTGNKKQWKSEILWHRVVVYVASHAAALYGFYLGLIEAKWATLLWSRIEIYCLQLLSRGFIDLYVINSICLDTNRRIRSHRWSSPSLVPQILQSQVAL